LSAWDLRCSPGIIARRPHGFWRATWACSIGLSGRWKCRLLTGPLLAAFIVLPLGQHSIAWFSLAALLAIVVLTRVGAWYKSRSRAHEKSRTAQNHPRLPSRKIGVGHGGFLIALVFSNIFYLASLGSYYTFLSDE